MFYSKKRPVIFPQSEHARLSGALASFWGNDRFSPPPIDFNSFVLGVTLHDHYFGEFDTLEIGNIDDEEWIRLIRKEALEKVFSDTTAQIVKLLHIKRLLEQKTKASKYSVLADELEEAIASHITKSHHSRTEFLAADTITDFCDSLAFDFCFEQESERRLPIFNNLSDTTVIEYKINASGLIQVDPWPFSKPEYHGYILAYQRKNYPQELDPLIVEYCLQET